LPCGCTGRATSPAARCRTARRLLALVVHRPWVMELLSLEDRLAPWTTPGGEQPPDSHNIYARMIWRLADRATGVPESDIAYVSEIARIFARSAYLMQRVASHDGDPQARAHDTMAAQICQLDATWRLARRVPAEHAVWQVLRDQAFVHGYRPLSSLHRAMAVELAGARNALARVCPHVLAALDPRFVPAPFDAAIHHICVALQALGDLRTWERDAASRRPSLVLAGLGLDALPTGPDALRALKLELIASGHLRGVLDLAADHLAIAREATADAPASRLATMLDELQQRVVAVRRLLP
jgi:hypothetical protein